MLKRNAHLAITYAMRFVTSDAKPPPSETNHYADAKLSIDNRGTNIYSTDIMALIAFEPDVLDAAYKRETLNKNPSEVVSHSRKWHNGIMRLLTLEASNPSYHSLQRIEALRQVYMFYLIRHSFTSESVHH
jgi:hypothetical protein